jgi:hypothetical protein
MSWFLPPGGKAAPEIAVGTTKGYLAGAGGILPGHFQEVQQLQAGGVINRPTLGLIGEQYRPEAVIPLQRGAVPVEMRGTSQVTVNINLNALDSVSGTDYLLENAPVIGQAVSQQLGLGGAFRAGVRRKLR